MTATQIITWIVGPVTLVAFIVSYTLLMLKVDARERMLVNAGLRDNDIIKAYKTNGQKKKSVCKLLSLIVEIALLVIFALLVFISVYSAAFSNDFPIFGVQVKLCGSNSMATVHEQTALIVPKENLLIKFNTEDLIILSPLPKEDKLKLYDIVSYKDEKNNILIVHRIVAIETTNEGTVYTMRGDANIVNDDDKITYENMRGIYKGKLLGMGAIVRFSHSSFFIVAIITCFYICILEEVLTKGLVKLDKKRLASLCLENNEQDNDNFKSTTS